MGTERQFMEKAISAARLCKSDLRDPLVGAVAVLNGKEIGVAFRGEMKPGEHAEYTLLEAHLADVALAGATVYTTLEPCTVRSASKVACVQRLIDRKIAKVVIGMLDPNPLVSGQGYRKLRRANIQTGFFPVDLMSQVEELNRNFIRAIEADPIFQVTQEIGLLAKRSGNSRQRDAIHVSLTETLRSLREIDRGEIRVIGREAGYFTRFLERLEEGEGVQRVKAYIRLTAFRPCEIVANSWFATFYEKLYAQARSGKLAMEYIFLLQTERVDSEVASFIDRYKAFANSIRVVWQGDVRISRAWLQPSIVLFEDQQIAFTHERGHDSTLIEATEWVSTEEFYKLEDRYRQIEIISQGYFVKASV